MAADWRLPKPEEKALLEVLFSEEWANRSSGWIADHHKINIKVVRKYRTHYGVNPEVIECADGRTIRKGMMGQQAGKTLTEKQRQLMEKAEPEAEKWAKIEGGKTKYELFSHDELVSIAYDAILVAVFYFDERKLAGVERSPGSKWRGYAVNGIKRAFRREAYKRRRHLSRVALFSDSAVGRKVVGERLKDGMATGDHLPEVEIPDGLYARLRELLPTQQATLEGMLGLDGKPPWTIEELAQFWGVPEWKASRMFDEAKAALME